MDDTALYECSIYRAPYHGGNEIIEFSRLRHKIFVEKMGWELPVEGRIEHDFYDIGISAFAITKERATGRVVAGIRLRPTTAQISIYGGTAVYSYMIRDAQRGLLPSIPMNLLDADAPVADDIWEGTRLVSDAGAGATYLTLHSAMAYLRSQNCTNALFLARTITQRLARKWGFDAIAMGPTIPIDGQPHRVFACSPNSRIQI